MATAIIGSMQEFQPGAETITAYLERLQAYLDANDIAEEKRASVLVSMIGHKTYDVLRSLMAPETPQKIEYKVLIRALKKHYEPKPLIIAERYIFHQRGQHPGESIAEYVAELCRLASTCNFGDFLEDALRDRLVCGLRSESARRRLLADAEGTTSLAKAIEQAQSYEQAEKNAKALKGTDAALKKLSATPPRRGNVESTSRRNRKPCYRCGRTNHMIQENVVLLSLPAIFATRRDTLPLHASGRKTAKPARKRIQRIRNISYPSRTIATLKNSTKIQSDRTLRNQLWLA